MYTHSKEIDLYKLDGNIALPSVDTSTLQWLSPLNSPFHIAGFPWLATDGIYRRLPIESTPDLTVAVDTLSYCTAGGQIRFQSNTSKLAIRIKLAGPANMYHMPATGQCGVDCYIGAHGEMQYIATSRFDPKSSEYEALMFNFSQCKSHHITLNLPLYQGVEEIWIGIDQEATVTAPIPYQSDEKIIIYGTSITQGGCASRPGMAYTNILSRVIPYEFINLGFSGSGKGEPEIAHLMSNINKPKLFILDYEGNTGEAHNIERTLPPFISILREKHPFVPILVLSKSKGAAPNIFVEKNQLNNIRREIQAKHVEYLRSLGDKNIYFVNGYTYQAINDECESTVDGVHPTDLGFWNIAKSLEPHIKALL